jgi:6,7-dimethyl-8-ribityllumazine synthase
VEGILVARGLRFAVVAARFNQAVVDRLLEGALDCLLRHGAGSSDLMVLRVPGAFELPIAAKLAAESGEHDAVVCLGALVRGATPHFDVLASQVTSALGQLALSSGVPIGFGLLTCDTMEQALERAGLKGGNKGFEAALAAIETVNLLRELKGRGPSPGSRS